MAKADTAREEERGMARQAKTRPARGENATNDSLLIRSAESLGRVIGSLQRQLEAARHLTDRADGAQFRRNGHVPARQQSGGAAKTQRKTKSARPDAGSKLASAADRKSKRAAKSAAKKTAGRNRSESKQRAAKASRGR
jgi:hypothetical protein